MFEAFLEMTNENRRNEYVRRMEKNTELEKALHEDHGEKGIQEVVSLKTLIDAALDEEDENSDLVVVKGTVPLFDTITKIAKNIRSSTVFTTAVTIVIVVVGFSISLDVNSTLNCDRLDYRLRDRYDEVAIQRLTECGYSQNRANHILFKVSQTVFTIEAMVKILSEGQRPFRYFTDREEGIWNRLDFSIVVIGFIEQTPLRVIFRVFPVVMFRLLRLLRVFRLAKALPRLRSIVEALISGFSAVGWICLFILVFNYIMACAVSIQLFPKISFLSH